MTTTWKFVLVPAVQQSVEMPRDAHVIHVAMQVGQLCMWAIVEDHAPRVSRVFRVVGTGNPIFGATVFVGSAIDGQYVWHVFEVPA